jgi:hypothetical protein
VTPQFPLMRQGEKYILFLEFDNRPTLPKYPAADAQCVVTGVWNGRFRVENGRIKVSPEASLRFRQYESATEDEFLGQISATLR